VEHTSSGFESNYNHNKTIKQGEKYASSMEGHLEEEKD
jgi:hypothetical protein